MLHTTFLVWHPSGMPKFGKVLVFYSLSRQTQLPVSINEQCNTKIWSLHHSTHPYFAAGYGCCKASYLRISEECAGLCIRTKYVAVWRKALNYTNLTKENVTQKGKHFQGHRPHDNHSWSRVFSFRFFCPESHFGDTVLIQWYLHHDGAVRKALGSTHVILSMSLQRPTTCLCCGSSWHADKHLALCLNTLICILSTYAFCGWVQSCPENTLNKPDPAIVSGAWHGYQILHVSD